MCTRLKALCFYVNSFPIEPFAIFRASKSGERRFWITECSPISWSWGSRIVKVSGGVYASNKVRRLRTTNPRTDYQGIIVQSVMKVFNHSDCIETETTVCVCIQFSWENTLVTDRQLFSGFLLITPRKLISLALTVNVASGKEYSLLLLLLLKKAMRWFPELLFLLEGMLKVYTSVYLGPVHMGK